MSVFRTAYVYVRNSFAGVLKETDEGYSFKYDEDYLQSKEASVVSLTLPLQTETYNSKTLFSFFDGLIPEGWLFKVVTNNWKIDSHDRLCSAFAKTVISLVRDTLRPLLSKNPCKKHRILC